jgi:EAL and modified HD-GYP domain-containing signal transduction protein
MPLPSTRAAGDVLLARQPIYDRSVRVVAYELLVQRRDGSSASDEADASTTICEIGLNLAMDRPAHVPLTRAFLLEGHATALPPDRVMLSVGPDFHLDRAARTTVAELVAAGYQLALAGYEEGGPLEELLPLARVVGLDLATLDRGLLRHEVSRLRPLGAALLARGVEQHDDAELCQELGFDLLQGYFFCRPNIVSDRPLEVNAINRLELLRELQLVEADFEALHEIVVRDVALSFHLLRFINSAFFALPRRVESIRDALVLLGTVNVRRWATLMALAQVSDKPQELVVTGLVRARMCELIAETAGHADGDAFFTTGLFSVVDALTDRSMVELLASLPLSAEIIHALLNHDGAKGRTLRAVIAYERGDFAAVDDDLPPLRTPLAQLYSESVEWATGASRLLAA